MSTEYYTLEEAAKLLKLHPQTLRRWIHGGKLAARRFGRQFRLRLEDLERVAQAEAEPADMLQALEAVESSWASFSLSEKVLHRVAEDADLEYELS